MADRLAVGMRDAARLTGLSPSSLYRLIAAGELLAFRSGGRRLIRVAELQRYLADRERADNGQLRPAAPQQAQTGTLVPFPEYAAISAASPAAARGRSTSKRKRA